MLSLPWDVHMGRLLPVAFLSYFIVVEGEPFAGVRKGTRKRNHCYHYLPYFLPLLLWAAPSVIDLTPKPYTFHVFTSVLHLPPWEECHGVRELTDTIVG